MAGNAIQLAGVRKAFGAKVAVDDVSLSVAPGEMVSLLGPSGSGKSTALRMISGLLRSDTGQVTAHDRPVQSNGRLAGDVRALRRDVGVIFQQFNLVDRLSLLNNVRSATVLGIVGAGGIGQILWDTIRSFDYAATSAIMIIIVLSVSLIDFASQLLRRHLI